MHFSSSDIVWNPRCKENPITLTNFLMKFNTFLLSLSYRKESNVLIEGTVKKEGHIVPKSKRGGRDG
jgi:hypothetical protein